MKEVEDRGRSSSVTEAASPNGSGTTTLPNLSKEEIARYSRHLIMPEVGMDGQRKLKAASILLIGAGGLGSPLGLYLAAAGVGHLGLVDFDVVDYSNLTDARAEQRRRHRRALQNGGSQRRSLPDPQTGRV
jgi:hypothetical protein